MKKQIQHYLLLLLLLLPLGIQAQKQFPIYVTPTLTPPYSLNLSEYANFGSQKLMVIIQVNDLDIQNYPVKLHIKLETAGVTIETSPTIATTPIYLDGGATTMLFGEDLADYFNIDNLTFKGCSKQDYLRTGQLPEGFYRITVEALHYTKMVPISNAGIASAWMVVGKPPVLRNPRNAAELGQLPGSALTFSWLSSNVGNPTAAGNIQYTFEMWELRIPGINPNSVTVMAPFYEETTYATMLPVYPAILSLEPGMDYAWRVTASDASGMVPFEQEGHSELRTFTYSSRCDAASSLTAKKIGGSGTFRWDSEPNHTSYNVEMKNPNTGWSHEGVTYQEKAEFHDLTPGSVYELRVQSVCNSDPNSTSDFTDWVTLTIPESKPLYDSVSCPNCGCGDVTDAPELTNFTLRDDLQPGDTIINQRGTTRFIIKSVDNEGGTTYTGEFLFWAEIWGLKFICEYWDLQVNTDNVIVGMDFESVYDPQFLLDVDAAVDAVDELLGAVDVLTDSDIKDTLTYDGEMTSVYVDTDGNVVATTLDDKGQPQTKVIAKASDNENTLITNADGEAFVVSRDGEVMGVAEYQASGGGKSSKIKENNAEKEKDLSSQTVTFSASAGQKYGFDSYNDSKRNIQQQYLPLQNGYRPAYKSVPSYSTDVVTASTYDDIIFKDEMGIPPMQSSNGLTIRGGADGAEVALYAYVDSTQVAGKLRIKSYDEENKKLCIVSINGAKLPSKGELAKELNHIYGQAVITWEVETITLDDKVKYDDDVFNHGGSSGITVYNEDQKAVVKAFKNNGNDIDKDTYYLFFIAEAKDKERNIGGYMPLSYQIGFIYGEPNNSTIAHELGHGAFSLWHTFSGNPVINASEGNTQNLMDYSSGSPTELWSYQWDAVHDPAGMVLGFLQDESEGEMYNCTLKDFPVYNGLAEGEKGIGKGEIFTSTGLYSSTTTECDVSVYWHVLLENNTYLYDEEYPTGWYQEKDYFKITKSLITDYAIVNGGISCTFARDVEYADIAIGHFCLDRTISEDLFDFIDLYYSEVCKDECDVCNHSGRIERVGALYDIVEFAYSFGAVTALRYLTKEIAEEVVEESAEKFAREVLTETLEEGVETWSKSALKEGDYFIYYGFKEVDGGGKLLYLGKSFGDDLFARYTANQVKKMDAVIFNKLRNIPNNGTAKGVEQAIMELNGWIPDPLLRKGGTRVLSNKINSTTNTLYKNSGLNWLNKNIPDWKIVFKMN